jgi:hypothetical protein
VDVRKLAVGVGVGVTLALWSSALSGVAGALPPRAAELNGSPATTTGGAGGEHALDVTDTTTTTLPGSGDTSTTTTVPASGPGSTPPTTVPIGSPLPSPSAPNSAPRAGINTSATAATAYHDQGILTYGDAQFLGSPMNLRLNAPVVGMAATPDGSGYWLVAADGGIFTYGDAGFFGSAGAINLWAPIVGMASTPDGQGYWLVASDGGVFAYGDAGFFGSMGGQPLASPVEAVVPTHDGQGYWLVAQDGGVFAYGDAGYYGSMGGTNLHGNPIVAMAATPDSQGYYLVQGGGEVKTYGDAVSYGQMQGHPPVVGIALTLDAQGYWLVCGNGEVDSFGDAQNFGGNQNMVPTPPIGGIVASHDGQGYWLLDSESFSVGLSHPFPGAWDRIVTKALTQLGPSPDGANYCNPYGPCEEWCSLFATWVWESEGIAVPRFPFTGSVYTWAASHTGVLSPRAIPQAGDLVLYGTGPANASTSPHIGLVAQVWPDGAIDTIEGDAGPGPNGYTAVLVNGPFLPSASFMYNGFPIYGYAIP